MWISTPNFAWCFCLHMELHGNTSLLSVVVFVLSYKTTTKKHGRNFFLSVSTRVLNLSCWWRASVNINGTCIFIVLFTFESTLFGGCNTADGSDHTLWSGSYYIFLEKQQKTAKRIYLLWHFIWITPVCKVLIFRFFNNFYSYRDPTNFAGDTPKCPRLWIYLWEFRILNNWRTLPVLIKKMRVKDQRLYFYFYINCISSLLYYVFQRAFVLR